MAGKKLATPADLVVTAPLPQSLTMTLRQPVRHAVVAPRRNRTTHPLHAGAGQRPSQPTTIHHHDAPHVAPLSLQTMSRHHVAGGQHRSRNQKTTHLHHAVGYVAPLDRQMTNRHRAGAGQRQNRMTRQPLDVGKPPRAVGRQRPSSTMRMTSHSESH